MKSTKQQESDPIEEHKNGSSERHVNSKIPLVSVDNHINSTSTFNEDILQPKP